MNKKDFISEFKKNYQYICVMDNIIEYFFLNLYNKDESLEINLDRCSDYILSHDLADEVEI
jgi:hypothetical protein